MPLFDCKECGAVQMGYWHCRDKRENKAFWIRWWAVRIGGIVLVTAALVGRAIHG